MGVAERKERQKAELRDTILGAARKIFLSEGAEALTMRKIADAIEYSPGTIYLYFENREEIALQLVREGFEKLVAALRPAADVDDPLERIRAIGNAYLEFGLADPESYALIFMTKAKYVYAAMAPSRGESDCEPGSRAFDFLSSSVREAIARGAMKAIDSERAAEAFWSGLHGVVSLYITCPEMIGDVRAVAAVVQDSMLAGMRK